MIIAVKGHLSWAVATLLLTAGASALYVYERGSTTGLSGGSAAGLVFGAAGSALIVFAALLGMRRKFRALRLGRSATWLKGHIWLGALSLLLICYHGGFSFGGPLTTTLMVLMIAVTGSGFLGIALQQFMPRLMTEQLPLETIYEEIPHVCQQLREKARTLVGAVCGDIGPDPSDTPDASPGSPTDARIRRPEPSATARFSEALENSETLRDFWVARMGPYLQRRGGKDRDLSRKEKALNIFDDLRVKLGQPFYDTLEQLAEICEERRQIRMQERMHLVLHGWLMVHMPLTMALLVLGFVHALWALRY